MIVITGAEGFIGSCLVSLLNQHQYHDLVLVDDFGAVKDREKNLFGKIFSHKIDRVDFPEWLKMKANLVQFVFHFGARTDTTEKDEEIFKVLNLDYSKQLFRTCTEEGIPFVYASSAATYGNGEQGYEDREDIQATLQPMNPYGRSKNDFDKWVLAQSERPYFWAGLKFFNVYGPNEYHKGRMASVILHAFKQIKETGEVQLFQSHRSDYKDGEQKRDFIYVKDLCEVCLFLMQHRKDSGLYNLGTGTARTWNDLTTAIFKGLDLPVHIKYRPIPEDIRDTYQYFTEANMEKLRSIGYNKPFTTIEDGVGEYVRDYLNKQVYY